MMRKLPPLALLFVLSACGFQPLYGTHGAGSPQAVAALKQVEIASIPDRSGLYLRNYLTDKMPRGNLPAKWKLKISLGEQKIDLGILKDASATRAQLKITAWFTLQDINTGKDVFGGSTRATASYNILDNEFGTLVAEQNARERVLRQAGDDILTRTALFVRNPVQKP